MREINQTEVQAVAGAGLLINTTKTVIAAGSAAGSGLVAAGQGLFAAGSILTKPLVTGTVNVIKFLI
jgi:hypothetical protein